MGMFINGTDKTKLTGKENGYQLFIVCLAMTMPSFKVGIIHIEDNAMARWTTHPKDSSTRIYNSKLLNNSEKYNKWLKLFKNMI